jgi:hypothetical protein
MSIALRFLVDEDFDNDIVRGLLRRLLTLDIVRAQDTELSGTPDPIVLTGQHRMDACYSRTMSVP